MESAGEVTQRTTQLNPADLIQTMDLRRTRTTLEEDRTYTLSGTLSGKWVVYSHSEMVIQYRMRTDLIK